MYAFPSVYSPRKVEYTVRDTPEDGGSLAPITFTIYSTPTSPFSFQDYLNPDDARALADTLYKAADRVDGGDDRHFG